MPIKRVQFPDGSIKRIEVPEGATNDEILEFVTSQHQASQPWQPRQRTVDDLLQAARVQDSTDGMNGAQAFFAGAGKSLMDTGRGVKQLYHMAQDAIAPREDGVSRQSQDRHEQDMVDGRDGSLMGNGYGLAGNVAGNVAQILSPAVVLKGAAAVPQLSRAAPVLQTASRALLPNTARGAAAQGAALGFLQPVGSDDSRALNTAGGAAFGVAGAAVPRVVGAGYRAARDAITMPTSTGAQRAAVKTIRELVDDPAQLMTQNPSLVPGARRTLFDETLIPGIARLETKARGAHGDHWVQLDAANAQAREAAIRGFAGDESKVAQAIASRSRATSPLYAAADKVDGVETSRLLSQIKRLENAQEGRPAVQGALTTIRSLLTRQIPDAERMKAAITPLQDFIASDRTSATNREAARAAIAKIRAGEWPSATFTGGDAGTRGVAASRDAAKEALAHARRALGKSTTGQDKMRVISNARLTINDMLSGKYGGDSGAALSGARALMAVKGQLDRVAAKASPEFAQANSLFRQYSSGINRMESGLELLRRGSAGYDPLTQSYPLTPGKFGQQVKNLDGLVRDATGFRKATASNVFQPKDLATISAINDDLARAGKRLPYGNGGGSHTASQAELGIKLALKGLARKAPWIGPWLESMDSAGEQRVMAAMSEMLANPAEYRRVSAALPLQERKLVENAVALLGGTAGAVAIPSSK